MCRVGRRLISQPLQRGHRMRFDTTPRAGLARPSDAILRAAMRAVPTALTEDVLTIKHSIEPWPIEWLVTSVMQRDHPEAAARWAVHDLVQNGMFNVSDQGEIDLSCADWLWDWWCEGTVNLELNQLPDEDDSAADGEFETDSEEDDDQPQDTILSPLG